MLIQGFLLVPHLDMGVRIARGQVLVEAGHIAAVSLGKPLGTPDLGSDHCLISPGFIDAHVHLPQFDVIGYDGLPLLEWLRTAVFPAEARWADRDFAGDMTRRVTKRMLASGTTGIAAYATVHHEGTKAAIDALHESGMRAMVGQVLMDQQAPEELCRPAKQLLDEAERLEGRGRVEVAVTPRFAVSCSKELLHGAGGIARRRGLPVQTHLSETTDEVALVSQLHGGAGYVEVYSDAGLLGNRTILGHGIWVTPEERRVLSKTGSVVAHCPTANLFLQAGQMDAAKVAASGVRMALGSDVAGGPDISMIRVARAMIETGKRLRLLDPDVPLLTAEAAWRQITAGNAEALGWMDAGRIVEGNAADLIVIDPTRGPNAEPDWAKAPDPLAKLLYAWDDRWIERVIVGGRIAHTA